MPHPDPFPFFPLSLSLSVISTLKMFFPSRDESNPLSSLGCPLLLKKKKTHPFLFSPLSKCASIDPALEGGGI